MLMSAFKWGYFEVGAYIGNPGDRERVLNDFMLGRLDVGASNGPFTTSPFSISTP
jgi:hypothetical protein